MSNQTGSYEPLTSQNAALVLVDHQVGLMYPDGYEGYWNACNIVGDYSANKLNIDDVGFLTGVVDTLITEIGVDRDHVFATGVSRGGHMAFRLGPWE